MIDLERQYTYAVRMLTPRRGLLSRLIADYERVLDGKKPSGGWAQSKDGKATSRVVYDDEAPKRLTSEASGLAKDPGYKSEKERGLVTRCNVFARDLVRALGGEYPELEGTANEIAGQLAKSAKDPKGRWQQVAGAKGGVKKVLEQAQKFANDGKVVVAVWANEDGGHGHVAVVVPSEDGLSESKSWKVPVPYIAQAGPPIKARGGRDVFDSLPLSLGFGADKKDEVKFYLLAKP
jgi:hypothetical protein